MKIRYAIIRNEWSFDMVILPPFKAPIYNSHDAAHDLYADESKWIFPFFTRKIKTNVAFEIPNGYYGKVCGRSGMNTKGKFVALGTIDASYRGEIMVIMYSLLPKRIKRGDRIAQIIFEPCLTNIEMECVTHDQLNKTNRGDKGFGSSGS